MLHSSKINEKGRFLPSMIMTEETSEESQISEFFLIHDHYAAHHGYGDDNYAEGI